MSTVQNRLHAFGRYRDYAQQPTNDLPVSIHYAPMHLRKLSGFSESIKPFYAMSVNGWEERAGRETEFMQTVLLPLLLSFLFY